MQRSIRFGQKGSLLIDLIDLTHKVATEQSGRITDFDSAGMALTPSELICPLLPR
jgi:hypothetical protein